MFRSEDLHQWNYKNHSDSRLYTGSAYGSWTSYLEFIVLRKSSIIVMIVHALFVRTVYYLSLSIWLQNWVDSKIETYVFGPWQHSTYRYTRKCRTLWGEPEQADTGILCHIAAHNEKWNWFTNSNKISLAVKGLPVWNLILNVPGYMTTVENAIGTSPDYRIHGLISATRH